MYKSAEEIASDVLVKVAAKEGVIRKGIRKGWNFLFAKAPAPKKAPKPKVKPEPETPVVNVGKTKNGPTVTTEAKVDPKDKASKGVGVGGILGSAALGGGAGYMLANSKSTNQPV